MNDIVQVKATHASPQQRELPAGWRWVRLEEVCKQDRQIVESFSDEAGALTYFSLEHIEAETGRILKAPTEQVNDEGKSTTFYFDERHVLYGKLRPYLNKVALLNAPGRCTTEMIPLIPLDDTDREFLAWLLRRRETVDFAMQGKTGSRMPRADMDSLLKLSIPLPPLSEQRRIAGVLREQMAAVEKARTAAQARLEALKALPAAFLRQVFPQPGQPLPDGWRWVKLPDAVRRFNPHLRKLKTSEYQRSGSFPIIDQGQQEIVGYTNDQSCIIGAPLPLVVFGDHTKIAKHINRPFALGADGVVLLSTKKDIDSMFFYYWLNQVDLRELGYARHFSVLKNKSIPLPPLDEQERIVVELRSQMASVEKIRSAVEEEWATINALPAALLRRAFAGEL